VAVAAAVVVAVEPWVAAAAVDVLRWVAEGVVVLPWAAAGEADLQWVEWVAVAVPPWAEAEQDARLR